jgi:hypothetical protein
MLSSKNIDNLEAIDFPVEEVNKNLYRIYNNENVIIDACKILGYSYVPTKDNDDGFKETSLNNKRSVVSIKDAIDKVPTAYGTNNGVKTYRTYYPCYVDKTDKTSLHFVLIIRPGTNENKILECDSKFNSISF